MLSNVSSPFGKLRNQIKGKAPSITGFVTTQPTNLAYIVDELDNTNATIGKATVSSYGIIGTFVFDRGANFKPGMVGFKADAWGTAGSIVGYIDMSDNGSTFPVNNTIAFSVKNTSQGNPAVSNLVYVPSRYYKIRFVDTSAEEGNVILHEVDDLTWK